MQRLLHAAAAVLLFAAAPAAADSIALAGGDVLTGTLVELSDERYVFDHETLGRLEIPSDRVAAFTAGDGPPPVAADAEPEIRPGLFGTRFLRGWQRHIELGLNGSEGNTDEFDGIARLLGRAEDEHRRWKVDLAYFYSTRVNETSEHRANLELLRDWLTPGSRWFGFANARWDYDQFENWDHRVILGGGAGYELVKREELDLRGRLGLGLQRTFGGEESEIVPELRIGIDGEWRISDRVKLTAANDLFPNLREPGELRNVLDAALFLTVSEEDGLGFKLGVRDEYESDPDGDAEENDIRYYGALTIDF